ncbi:MAG: hypothetical protein PUB76_09440 [Oscillospiraceae bacterium]|nr:hypothetical protein [Oscillospiraceae bacterium]MDD6086169.1 hypothetical protein [Oscillospiraceae bacterium]MDY3258180.1 hypothetical protein [Ruminococcus callidus]
MKSFKKITAAAAAAAMCASMATGCTIGGNTANVLTVDGTDVNAGIYLYYAYSAYSEAVSYLTSKDSDLDKTDKKALKALTIKDPDTGESVGTEKWIQNKATELCQQYVAISKKFDELNLELSAEDQESIKTYVANYVGYYGTAIEKAGVSEDSIKAVITSSFKNSEIFKYYYGVDGEKGIDESEYYDFYKDNNARVRILTFSKKDGSGDALKDSALSDFEDMIDGYYDKISKCKTEDEKESMMDEVESEYEEYSSEQAELATAETDEDGNPVTEATTEEDTTEEDTTEDTSEDVTDTTEAESAEDNSNAEDTSKEDVSEENSTSEDTSADEDTSSEDASDEEDTTADESSTEEETTTTTAPFANEQVIAKSTTTTDIEGNTPDEDDITYSPSKSVQQALFDEGNKNYIKNGELKLINDDETEYIILRRDIEERMTDSDLWTDDAINTVASDIYGDQYQDELKEWADSYDTDKNNSAYKRYDVFEIDLYGQDNQTASN